MLLFAAVLPSQAASIPGLFNTGVDGAGALLPAGAVDSHYRLVQSADAGFSGPDTMVVNEAYPIPPWLFNGPASKWIAPRADQGVGNAEGNYTYRLTFDLTGLQTASAQVTGQWTSDNGGMDMLLNGISLGLSQGGDFTRFAGQFALAGGFVDGLNTLDFVVNNAPAGVNPTGLRVEISGVAEPDAAPGTPPSIVGPPQGASAPVGGTARFSVLAAGSPPLGFQWRFSGLNLTDATNQVLTLASISTSNEGFYSVVVSNDFGAVTSRVARLAVTRPIPGLFNTGVDNNRALLASGSVDPHYRLVQSADGAFPGPNAMVLNDAGFPIPPWLANGPNSKWLAPQASQASGNQFGDYKYRLSFDLIDLDPATAVITGLWTSDNTGPSLLLNGVATGAASDGNFGALGNAFTISSGFVVGSNALDFVVNNAPPGINPTGVRVEFTGTAAEALPPPGTPPTITFHPASQTVLSGDGAFFSASAFGSAPLSFQWRRDGTPIPGGTNAVLVFFCVTTNQAGVYDALVTNAFGSATTETATLVVIPVLVNPSPAELAYEPPGPSSRRTGMTISEIMYHPADRVDGRNVEFIELYNSNPFFEDLSGWRLTGAFDYTFPPNTILAGKSFLVVAPAPLDVQAAYGISGVLGGSTNTLPNRSGTVRLRKRSGAVVLEVNYSDQPPWPVAADGTGHSLVLARPTYGESNPQAWAASAFKGGSPGTADPVPAGPLENVVINELLAHTPGLPGTADFVELYNHSAVKVDLSGCWLSDDPRTNKFRIADGTTLAPRGFISYPEPQLGFALAAEGGTVFLVHSNQNRVIDAVRFGGQASGVSIGRCPDGAPAFSALATPTPGTTNAPLRLRDVVINEIM
ncbi:MAG TPA: lamin tail domain-containing protein, partial [Verrucomicrobiae bacterium]